MLKLHAHDWDGGSMCFRFERRHNAADAQSRADVTAAVAGGATWLGAGVKPRQERGFEAVPQQLGMEL